MLSRMTLKSLLHRPGAAVWTLIALGACAALAAAFTTVALDVEEKMTSTLRELGANAVLFEDRANSAPLRWDEVERTARELQIDLVPLHAFAGETAGIAVSVVRAEPAALARMTPYWNIDGRRATQENECVIGARLAARLEVTPGASLEVQAPLGAELTLDVVGVFQSGDEDDDRLFAPALPAGALLPGARYALLAAPQGERDLTRLDAALQTANLPVTLRPLRQVLHGEQVILKRVGLLGGVTLAAVLLLTALGVGAAVAARVAERRRELALLRALGARKRSVAGLLLAENATLGVVAALVGFGAGTLIADALARSIFGVAITPRPAAALAALVVSLGVAVSAAVLASRRSMSVRPAVALRGE